MNSNNGFSKFLKSFLLIFIALIIGGTILIAFNYSDVWSKPKGVEKEVESFALNREPPVTPSKVVVMGPTNIPDMVEQVSPAVVNIETSASANNDEIFNDPFFRYFLGDSYMPKTNITQGIGTGFIISEDGYVVTNQHVVDKADTIIVNIDSTEKYNASIIGQDYELDLAVLKIEADKKFATLKMGDSDKIRVGEWVIAIGNPYGLDHTVTAGLISAKGRPINIENRVYKNLIQTDAAINPGNSGGPLLDTNGQVIGINTAVNANAQGIGFAIPINTAKEVLDELITEGKIIRPYIGIWFQAVDQQIADYLGIAKEGVIISTVNPNSPASKSGLKKYDIILSINDTKITNTDMVNEIIAKKKVNDTITIKIWREGKHYDINVQLAEKP
ncbi:MAG: PDZ domain-containing protein [Syntrophomonadaceae bacterium]|nr:PDZ domain-containing protein [Syntrophomonadaceae bacterium]